MSETPEDAPKIHVDDDWKAQAQQEKERLSEETKDVGERQQLPEPAFTEIINLLMMQTVIGLGGMTMPDGRKIPQDLEVAKHHIDLLEILERKTAGNLDDDEQRLLSTALYELRMRFVQATGAPAPKQD
jgi:hypothetical protein